MSQESTQQGPIDFLIGVLPPRLSAALKAVLCVSHLSAPWPIELRMLDSQDALSDCIIVLSTT